MELQTLKTIEIQTFDPGKPSIKVLVPVEDGLVYTDKMFAAVTEAIGLTEYSQRYFRLFEGLLSPVQCFTSDQAIPENVDDLSLQKWCFDVQEEQKMIKEDEAALRLVFFQTKAMVDIGEIKTSKADLDQLEDYLDPAFTLYDQYVKLCQTLEGYHSYQFNQCAALYKSPVIQQSVIKNSVTCDIVLDLKSWKISIGDTVDVYQWGDVKFWQLDIESQEVYLQLCKCEVTEELCDVIITSHRCQMLVEVIKAAITQLQKTTPDSPKFHVSMITSLEGGITRWENALYKHRNTHLD